MSVDVVLGTHKLHYEKPHPDGEERAEHLVPAMKTWLVDLPQAVELVDAYMRIIDWYIGKLNAIYQYIKKLVKIARSVSWANALRNSSALRARLPYAAPGCSWFLGRSKHTRGTRAQQEDSVGLNPQPLNIFVFRGAGATTELPPTPMEGQWPT